MIFWCILAFFTTGFEHSVANMTLLSVALIHPASQMITWSGWIYNLAIVTLGNMVGGIVFVSLPYFIISRNSV
jgi:nitrite transporter NirC